MNIRQTIIKLLTRYLPEHIIMHLYHELELEANHYETVGAPIRAAYIRRQVAVLHETEKKLNELPYQYESTIDAKPKP
jgi:hypothetical protein